jgi:predicted metalloprotease with PDZ domain
MKYTVSYQQPHHHFIDFVWEIDQINQPQIELQLPAWRPGRYELQHFAKNIQQFRVTGASGQPLAFRKVRRDRWQVDTAGQARIWVSYNYFAQQMDAGGSWLDEELFYLNPVNACMYVVGRQGEPYELHLELPSGYQIATGLARQGNVLYASNFAELADCPILATATRLQHQTYHVPNSPAMFHLWFYGEVKPDWPRLLADFGQFTQKQIEIFGGQPADFPVSDYHFLYLFPAWQVYHGVEHRNSTTIVLGPSGLYDQTYFYNDVLGVGSHELFHFWNICRIRPVELLPYDYTQENYFRTGFVAEGLTTYYGDYLLARSGVWDMNLYFKELGKLLTKHFENFGRFNLSVADSSFDLWLDGYSAGIPRRKVSIYTEGAVAALILDLELRQHTQHQRSLDDVLRLLWARFGQAGVGYSLADYQALVAEVAGRDMSDYFADCIFGTTDLTARLQRALAVVACELIIAPSEKTNERVFGFRVNSQADKHLVTLIAPGSPADAGLALRDRVLSVDGQAVKDQNLEELLAGKTEVVLKVNRWERELEVRLQADDQTYLPTYSCNFAEDFDEAGRAGFERWMLA